MPAACAVVGSSYPFLTDPNSTLPFFPSYPFVVNGSNGSGPIPGPNSSSPPFPPPLPRPNITDGQVARYFAEVCGTPAFSDALNASGLRSFSVGGSYDARNGTGFVGFSFAWAGACPTGPYGYYDSCTFQESWMANTTSGRIIGPTLDVYPSSSSGYGPGSTAPTSQSGPLPFGAAAPNWPAALVLWSLAGLVVVAAGYLDRRPR